MTKISRRSFDKLLALLNGTNHGAGEIVPWTYIDACSTWRAGLTESERQIADRALSAYLRGDESSALKIAAALPAAPKCPVVAM